MSAYLLLKTLHIISSVILVGTGFGSAFYLFFANRSKRLEVQAFVARFVVLADWIFTTPTIILQLVTGIGLAHMAGWPLTTPWILISLGLYFFAGACWLPVVRLQIRMKTMLEEALQKKEPVSELYWRYAKRWELLGYPAFAAMIAVYYLMVNKPTF